jgi:glycosyltransferase involved in cell wall biosynthesis
LRDEIRESGARTDEVLLVHDGNVEETGDAERLLATAGVEVRAISVPLAGYYQLKNAGAREARGEIVVLLDCDVIPEEAWLQELLAPFADPEVQVVAGQTCLETDGLLAKCLALTSVFPLPAEPSPVARTDRFFANSLALRRETALAFPFPDIPGSSRVSCVALARKMADANVVVVTSPAARGRHPTPAGIRRAAMRAAVHGRDTVLLADFGAGPPVSPGAGIRRVARTLRSVVHDREKVALPALATPLALAVAVLYQGFVAGGAAAARIAPSAARRLTL